MATISPPIRTLALVAAAWLLTPLWAHADDTAEDASDADAPPSVPSVPSVRSVPSAGAAPLAIPGSAGPRLAPPPPARIATPPPAQNSEAFRSRELTVRTLPGYTTGPWFGDEPAWSVYRGAYRLDVPSTLNTLGRLDEQRGLEGRIARNRTASTVLTGVGVAGVAATIVGLTGRREASTYDVARDWSLVSTAGLAMVVGGFITAAIPGQRARRLQFSHATTQSVEAVGRDVEAYNARLASELGVGPPKGDGQGWPR